MGRTIWEVLFCCVVQLFFGFCFFLMFTSHKAHEAVKSNSYCYYASFYGGLISIRASVAQRAVSTICLTKSLQSAPFWTICNKHSCVVLLFLPPTPATPGFAPRQFSSPAQKMSLITSLNHHITSQQLKKHLLQYFFFFLPGLRLQCTFCLHGSYTHIGTSSPTSNTTEELYFLACK